MASIIIRKQGRCQGISWWSKKVRTSEKLGVRGLPPQDIISIDPYVNCIKVTFIIIIIIIFLIFFSISPLFFFLSLLMGIVLAVFNTMGQVLFYESLHTSNRLELMRSFRHAALLFWRSLFPLIVLSSGAVCCG